MEENRNLQSQSVQSINDQLLLLANNIKTDLQEMEEQDAQTQAKLDEIMESINKSAAVVNDICLQLDKIEKDFGDEFDRLILQEAEDLAEEEEEDLKEGFF
jgi:transcriptional accessory protein Tex/SPT6